MFFFDPVEPLAGAVVLGVVHHVPAVFPVVRVGGVIFRVKRVEVDLAERAGPSPGGLMPLHKSWDVGIDPIAIGEQTVAGAGQTGGDAGPGRTANWVIGEGIGEGHTHALVAFQVRHVADAVHGRFQLFRAHMVDHQEDDIRFCCHVSSHLLDSGQFDSLYQPL